jgi:hypothetical protein
MTVLCSIQFHWSDCFNFSFSFLSFWLGLRAIRLTAWLTQRSVTVVRSRSHHAKA